MWQLYLLVGGVFGALAAAMALLITYEEYSHHHLPRRQMIQQSLQMAGATVLFFLFVMLAVSVASGACVASSPVSSESLARAGG